MMIKAKQKQNKTKQKTKKQTNKTKHRPPHTHTELFWIDKPTQNSTYSTQ